MFWLRNKDIGFDYALLSGDLSHYLEAESTHNMCSGCEERKLSKLILLLVCTYLDSLVWNLL